MGSNSPLGHLSACQKASQHEYDGGQRARRLVVRADPVKVCGLYGVRLQKSLLASRRCLFHPFCQAFDIGSD